MICHTLFSMRLSQFLAEIHPAIRRGGSGIWVGVVVAVPSVACCGLLLVTPDDLLERLALFVALALLADHVALRVVGIPLLVAVVALVRSQLVVAVIGVGIHLRAKGFARQVAVGVVVA